MAKVVTIPRNEPGLVTVKRDSATKKLVAADVEAMAAVYALISETPRRVREIREARKASARET